MNIIKLSYINELRERIQAKNGLIQVLIGPRQVGKTTSILQLIESNFKDQAHYVSADAIFNSDANWLVQQWQIAESKNQILFVDEIQKCQNWAEVIKKLFDQAKREKKTSRCVLLGSSSLEIQKGLTESLTGRFQMTRAYHWNHSESNELIPMSLDKFFQFGGYPGSYSFIGKTDWIDYVQTSIVNTVVEKDILQYQSVKNPALFRQSFEILCAYPAQEISYTKLLGQLQDKGNVEIVKNYIRLFEGAFLIRALEKYSSKKIKTKSSSPKILPLAPCLFQITIQDSYSTEEKGRVFELVVGTQLVRTNLPLFYWREGNAEVDFVLTKGRKVWAIEVKSGRRKDKKGLLAFKNKFPTAKAVFIDLESYAEFEKDPIAYIEKHEF